MKYRVFIKLGWDKIYYRTFDSISKCENWINKWYKKYKPSQIIATWINDEPFENRFQG